MLALPFPNIPPSLFSIGPVGVRWYGLMYVLGFIFCFLFLAKQSKKGRIPLNVAQLESLVFFVFFGILLGGRLGYVLFYNLPYYLAHPLEIISLWEGGMSFHGGLVGVVIALFLFAKKYKFHPLTVGDALVLPLPIALGLGRIGNFINGELFGKATTLPWCMVFPEGGDLCRHPSQLYEALLEGAVLFFLLLFIAKKSPRRGILVGYFFLFYGLFRFLIEFVRQPDHQLGTLALQLTMGQWLSLPLIITGVILLIVLQKTTPSPKTQ
jgi:phosphatidylglycerol:prolipoprotein diacylglycerol transferase